MKRNPVIAVTEGEVIQLNEIASGTAITEIPIATERMLIARGDGWHQKDKAGNDTGLVNYHIDIVDPTANDDSTLGFLATSVWVNETSDDAFICVDNSVDAAIWQKFVSGGSTDSSVEFDWDADKSKTPVERQVGNILIFEMKFNQEKALLGTENMPFQSNLNENPQIKIPFIVFSTGSAGNVRFELQATYITIGELADKAADETLLFTKVIVNTLNELHEHTFTLDKAKIAIGDVISLRFARLGDDALDTFGGNIGVLRRSLFTYKGL